MSSLEHQLFLKKIRREKLWIKTTQLLILVVFIITWQLLASTKIINTFITSSPINIVKTIINLHNSNNLYHHIFVTIYETIVSFSLGTIIGTIIASIMWWNKFIARVLDPYLTILNSLPKVALGPILIIWVGAGMNSIIVMALLISLIITIINIYDGFSKTDNNKVNLLKSFKASKAQIFFKLVFPSSIRTIINSAKINVSMSLIGIIMGEFLVSKEGIGYLIMYGSQVFNLNLVITGIIILCIVATLLYYIVAYIEQRLIKNN